MSFELPWLGARRGYEDWYPTGGFGDLQGLNRAAVGPALRAAHDRPALAAAGGAGGLHTVHSGRPDLHATTVSWVAKPRGTTYGDFHAGLPAVPCLLRRQLVLGPAPEFCAFGELPGPTVVSHREPLFPGLQ